VKLSLAKRAADDIEAIQRYISRESPRGAANVIAAIEAAIGFIAVHPEACPRVLPGIRMKTVRPYGYKIFFAASETSIEILHIRHPSRSPEWK
jgi:plasmid stabilization system protein ParE